jgi:hypothetical protein
MVLLYAPNTNFLSEVRIPLSLSEWALAPLKLMIHRNRLRIECASSARSLHPFFVFNFRRRRRFPPPLLFIYWERKKGFDERKRSRRPTIFDSRSALAFSLTCTSLCERCAPQLFSLFPDRPRNILRIKSYSPWWFPREASRRPRTRRLIYDRNWLLFNHTDALTRSFACAALCLWNILTLRFTLASRPFQKLLYFWAANFFTHVCIKY